MSHYIEYDSVFLKSTGGYTPCSFGGDNNVWETDRRRARSWSVFRNMVAVSADELFVSVNNMLGSDEHWERNGKYLDDAALIRWVKSGIKNAQTAEEVISLNRLGSIRCSASVWYSLDNKEELVAYVHTTEELDKWVKSFKALKAQVSVTPGGCVYPILNLGCSKLQKLKSASKNAGPVILKYKNMYLSAQNSRGTTWKRSAANALELSREDAMALKQDANTDYYLARSQIVSATVKQQANAVLMLGDGTYVYQVTSRRLFKTALAGSAKRYSSLKSAKSAAENIQKKYPSLCPIIVKAIEKEDMSA